MVRKELQNVVAYELSFDGLIVLLDDGTKSELVKYSLLSLTEKWRTELGRSYDFISIGEFILVTTRSEVVKTLVFENDSGRFLNELHELVLHLSIKHKTSSSIITFANYLSEDKFISLSNELDKIVILNPKGLKLSRVIDENRFMSIDKATLSLVNFSNSIIIWQIDLIRHLPLLTEESRSKMRLQGIYLFDTILVASVFNLKDNSQFLIGINIVTGESLWIKKNELNIGSNNKHLYSTSYEGLLKIIDPLTGDVLDVKDNRKAFSYESINCDRGLKYHKDFFLFKDDIQRKIGLLNLLNLELFKTYQLPTNITLSAHDYPTISNNMLVAHSPLNKVLYLQKDYPA